MAVIRDHGGLKTTICLAAALVICISGKQNVVNDSITARRTHEQKLGKCEKITVPLCKNISYNNTIMPNILGHKNQDKAAREIDMYLPLVETTCSKYLKEFLCVVYVPVCTLLGEALPPCRPLCISAKKGCEGLGFIFPSSLRCNRFPVSGGCVAGSAGPDSFMSTLDTVMKSEKISSGDVEVDVRRLPPISSGDIFDENLLEQNNAKLIIPKKVMARPWLNSSILVSWSAPSFDDIHFKIGYKGCRKTMCIEDSVLVTSPDEAGRWTAVLQSLPTRIKYNIWVKSTDVSEGHGFNSSSYYGTSTPVVFRHRGFSSELSIAVRPLTTQTALVTLRAVGTADITNVRVLFSDEKAIAWRRMETFKTFDPDETYMIVNDLQPMASYFFMAKARVNNRARQTVTCLVMPPSSLEPPTNVSVEHFTYYNDWWVTWQPPPKRVKGHIVYIRRELNAGQLMAHSEHVQLSTRKKFILRDSSLVKGLEDGHKYQVSVASFGVDSTSAPSGAVRLSLSITGGNPL